MIKKANIVILFSLLLGGIINIAKAQTFITADSAMTGEIKAFAVYNNEMYAGGFIFQNLPDGRTIKTLAKWDGHKWTPAWNNHFLGGILTLASYNGALYAGGDIRSGRSKQAFLAKWDGHGWDSVALGVNGRVMSLAEYNGDLYACVNEKYNDCIVRWDGKTWTRITGKMQGEIDAMTVYKRQLYVGGQMDSLPNEINDTIAMAKWDGKTWTSANNMFDGNTKTEFGEIRSMYTFKDHLFIAYEVPHYPASSTAAFKMYDGSGNKAMVADTTESS